MLLQDVFKANPFQMVNLTAAVNAMPFVPGLLGGMGLFTEKGINTTTAVIEKKGNTLSLVPTSERGSPAEQKVRNKRDVRSLTIPHLSQEAVIYAEQIQNVRAFGASGELEAVETVVAQEMAAINLNMDMTLENLRLGAVKGILYDADGSVIYNLFTEFGVAQLAEFDFALATTTTDVRGKCQALRRLMAKELKMGALFPNFMIVGLCSDGFFDDLLAHESVKRAVEFWNEGQALRADFTFQHFDHGGIRFINYRGGDDGDVSVAAGKAHFFPVGVPGLFDCAFAPGDTVGTVNTVGLPRYAFPNLDHRADPKWMSIEIQSNPLPICTQPRVLMKAKAA